MKQFNIVGPKGVLVELKPFVSESITEAGVIVPSFDNYETEGQGKVKSKLSDAVKWSSKGTVLQISEAAKEYIEDKKIGISEGDVVYVNQNSVHRSNQFLINRETPTTSFDFNGYVLIYPHEIEAVENSNKNHE